MQGVGEQVLEALVLEIVDVAHGRVEYPLAIGVLADPGPGCRLFTLVLKDHQHDVVVSKRSLGRAALARAHGGVVVDFAVTFPT